MCIFRKSSFCLKVIVTDLKTLNIKYDEEIQFFCVRCQLHICCLETSYYIVVIFSQLIKYMIFSKKKMKHLIGSEAQRECLVVHGDYKRGSSKSNVRAKPTSVRDR